MFQASMNSLSVGRQVTKFHAIALPLIGGRTALDRSAALCHSSASSFPRKRESRFSGFFDGCLDFRLRGNDG
jgi:hypothetical protein